MQFCDQIFFLRLQSHSVPSDSTYLIWKSNVLLTAPLYSGVVQAVDSEKEREIRTLVGSIRRIDAVALYDSLIATAEARWVKLWSLKENRPLYSFEDNGDYVYDVAWSPQHPALFATVDGTGSLDLWNLNSDTEVATASVSVEGTPALNRVSWTQSGLHVTAGDDQVGSSERTRIALHQLSLSDK